MKNKKGFTMAELLAVIAILGLLLLVGFSVLINVLDQLREQTYQLQLSEIKDATRTYIAENSGKIEALWTVGTPYKITLRTLNKAGNIELPIKNPKTNQDFVPEGVEITITKLENGTHKIDINVKLTDE